MNVEAKANEFLNDTITVVNLIKVVPLHENTFSIFYNETSSQYYNLCLHSEITWLARGRVLIAVIQLKGLPEFTVWTITKFFVER
jgi:hypothetical protein